MRKSIPAQSGVALLVILAGIAVFTMVGLVMTRAPSDFDSGVFAEQSSKAMAAAVVADSAAIVSLVKEMRGPGFGAVDADLSEDRMRGVFAPGRLAAEQKQPPLKAIAPGASSPAYQLGQLAVPGFATTGVVQGAVFHARIVREACLAINRKVNGVNAIPAAAGATTEQLFLGYDLCTDANLASVTYGWAAGCVQGSEDGATAAYFAVYGTL